jgi:hypothetical protein
MSNPGTTSLPGLINTAPGLSTTQNNNPDGSPQTQPVAGYTPATATAAPAQTSSYDPSKFNVTPEQTVAGQIKNIIAENSPLMQQAEAQAKATANSRGLINSSIGCWRWSGGRHRQGDADRDSRRRHLCHRRDQQHQRRECGEGG